MWPSLKKNCGCGFDRMKGANLKRNPDALDADALIHDLNNSLSDMPLITRPNAGPSTLLPRRLRLLGLDPGFVAVAQPETFSKLEAACSACPSWRRCARDLARNDVTAGMECYCLNAAALDELLIEKFTG